MFRFIQCMFRLGKISEAEIRAFQAKGLLTEEEADRILEENNQ